jgi:hypothetical protein
MARARLLGDAAKAATPSLDVQPYSLGDTDACDVGHRLKKNLGICSQGPYTRNQCVSPTSVIPPELLWLAVAFIMLMAGFLTASAE